MHFYMLMLSSSAAGNFFVSIWGEVLDLVRYSTALPRILWHVANCLSRNRTVREHQSNIVRIYIVIGDIV